MTSLLVACMAALTGINCLILAVAVLVFLKHLKAVSYQHKPLGTIPVREDPIAAKLTEEMKARLEEENKAFAQLLGYNVEQAYGLNRKEGV